MLVDSSLWIDYLKGTARDLNVSRQAVIKALVQQALDRHYLAQRRQRAAAGALAGFGALRLRQNRKCGEAGPRNRARSQGGPARMAKPWAGGKVCPRRDATSAKS